LPRNFFTVDKIRVFSYNEEVFEKQVKETLFRYYFRELSVGER